MTDEKNADVIITDNPNYGEDMETLDDWESIAAGILKELQTEKPWLYGHLSLHEFMQICPFKMKIVKGDEKTPVSQQD